jgi:hypothetical protein
VSELLTFDGGRKKSVRFNGKLDFNFGSKVEVAKIEDSPVKQLQIIEENTDEKLTQLKKSNIERENL